ncbi:hypothetical protein [Nonomuraea rhodomycinica]|uniref:Uncharacterized protein n=1 Tax=Nonomuraea rhodomycinica TaxID=1712872 RepID=A0A7Y6IWT5_9ACTN|nr:hypothetical protein [Nonomuraea rhodomycinica]NUW45523.1 hypothetical protein [Nonomuraea rhodomycinica]
MTATKLRVPYITAYSGEEVEGKLVLRWHPEAAGLRLAYVDEVALDRMFGVLWARQGISRGGAPQWKLVNSLRQRRAMLRNLCQVCGRPATDPISGRVWWVLADDPTDTSDGAGYTNAPPTCRSCIPEAIASCPRLRRSAAVYTVGGSEPYGVLAAVVQESTSNGEIVLKKNVPIPLDAFQRLELAMATQLLVVVRDLRREAIP